MLWGAWSAAGTPVPVQLPELEHKTDEEALRAAWEAVGQSLWAAMGAFEREQGWGDDNDARRDAGRRDAESPVP